MEIEESKLPIARFKHCYMVGTVMEYVSKKYFNYTLQESKDMFLLGFLHDSMYDFENEFFSHNEIISKLVPDKFKKELLYHSGIQNKYSSLNLDILYLADEVVNGYGEIGKFSERIKDIKKRHGKESKNYMETINLINYLNKKAIYKIIEFDVSSNNEIKNTHIPLEEIKSAYIKAIGFNRPEKFLYIFLENLKIYLDNKTVDEIQNYVKDKKGELLYTI
jgi:uncharacterized FAD-dependent dehydrogenase